MFCCFGRSSKDEPLLNEIEFEQLTKEQVEMMKESWQTVSESHTIGADILSALITNKPIFASFFGIEGGKIEEMRKSEKFLIQAGRIEGLIDTTITSIGRVPEQTIRSYSRNVGKIHFYHGVNFTGDNWEFFRGVMNSQLSQASGSELDQEWESFTEMIVSEMKMGFLLEATAAAEEKHTDNEHISKSLTSKLWQSVSTPKPVKPSASKGDKLTEKEIGLCRQTWAEAKDRDIGMKILLSLIESKPAFAKHFKVDEKMSLEELETEPKIKIQASRIQGLIDTVITLYGVVPNSKIRDMCVGIGRIHFHKGVNFTADNWLLFKRVCIEKVMENVVVQGHFGPENKVMASLRAWHGLMSIVIHSMKEGFIQVASGKC